jgi:hypothetical protein
MKATLRAFALSLAIGATLSAQSSIQGAWAGELPGEGGAQQVQLSITVTEGHVGGSVIGSGAALSIQEASIDGSTVEFTTTQQRDGADVKFRWTGAITDNEITFTIAAEGGQPVPLVVRRLAS